MDSKNIKTRYALTSVRHDYERTVFFIFILFISIISLNNFGFVKQAEAVYATTTISVAICGNGIVDGTEACDDGSAKNDGEYATSSATRHCAPNCRSFGPYCGDAILQAYYTEECDDGNNTSGDKCNNACKQEEKPNATGTPPAPPPSPSGSGGSSTGDVPIRAQTQVILEGRAYPNSRVQILKDGQLVGMAQSDSQAKFSYIISNATPGPTTFGFWSEDSKQIRSITYTTTFQVTQNAVTNVGNIYIPPTIRAMVKRLAPGALLSLDGTTVPNSSVSILTDKNKIPAMTATSSSNGSWEMKLSTQGLTPEIYHQIMPYFEMSQGAGSVRAKSGTGIALNIFVGNNEVNSDRKTKTDFNNDGKVNLTDFSMLLYRWGSSDPTCDLNNDGKVNIADFSVLLFNWTG